MLINKAEEKIIDDYIKDNHQIKQYFINGSNEIKNEISKNMAYRICDKVYETRSSVVPNEKDIQEKITILMDEIINDYYREIDGYVRMQDNTISDLTDNIGNDKLEVNHIVLLDFLSKQVNYIEIEQDMEIINRITDRVLTHISFRNQNNPDYYKIKQDIEFYVREEVSNKMDLFKEEIDNIYENILSQLNDKRIDMFDTVSNFGKLEEEKIFQDELEIIDTSSRTLDPNIIFGDEENENSKRFR